MRGPRNWTTPLVMAGLGLALATAVLGKGLPRLPRDFAFPQSADSPGKVTFSHATHVDQTRPDCTTCHPKLFRMLQTGMPVEGLPILHTQMEQGRQCGACHNGKTACAFEDDCTVCHR